MIGKKLDGRYELEQLIGEGGMAQVYRARDLANGRIVAVKVLKEQFLDNDEILQRFKNESRAISIMDHPNIVRVYDVSVWDKTQFIVMELVEGEDLKHFIESSGGRLSWKQTISCVEQTLQALQHAHEHGIVHRDIKPQNIMRLPDGTIKVMDFGIARFSRSGVHTATDKAMGSVHYISPEQARGDVTDKQSDIYSVGVMMYEMLTGQLPFTGESSVAVAIKQISEPPRPPHELVPDLPEGLETIVLRAMEKDPAARYASAQDMLEDIARFKENPSIQFAYQYMQDSPTRYVDTVKKTTPAPAGKGAAQGRGGAAGRTTAGKTKTKKRRGPSHFILPVLAGMAFAFLVGSTVLVYMIFHFSGNTLFEEREDVELPSFVGMDVDSVIHDKDYTSQFSFTVHESYRSDYEAGTIYDQSPKSGKMVKEGHEIILRVSKGVQIVDVPNVVGYTKDEAVTALSALDLSVLVRYETDSTVPLGQVIRTDPAADTQLSSGQQITVYVSAEKVDNMRSVPNLIGLTSLEEATKLLNQYTLSLGTATGVESEQPAGTILDQSVPEGTSVYTGSTINVSYSLGYITREWKVKVRIVAEAAGTILNGQKVAYPGGEYVTEGGGLTQEFDFPVRTQTASETIHIGGKEFTISGDTEIQLTLKAANRPVGCTCAAGENHDAKNAACALNKASSESSGNSGSSSGSKVPSSSSAPSSSSSAPSSSDSAPSSSDSTPSSSDSTPSSSDSTPSSSESTDSSEGTGGADSSSESQPDTTGGGDSSAAGDAP